MKKVLLHTCCGICAGWPIQRLQAEGYAVTCFYFNPNIAPCDEYERRREAARTAATILGCGFEEGAYDHAAWRERVYGMESHPEGGARCAVCFRMRLAAALEAMRRLGADHLATTLTVSPHKNAVMINAIGVSLAPDRFLAIDFKKEDGFLKTTRFAAENGLYRQDYCGCPFSKKTL